MTREYRYAGPDGAGIAGLPPGVGAAIGSDYCVHLLPGAAELSRAIAAARARDVPLILLTPYFRDAELKSAIRLFRAIPEGDDLVVAVSDWGGLLAARTLLPRLNLSVGRLLSGQKRCPRIGISRRLTEAGKAWHAEGLFSSPGARACLRDALGISRYHVDLPAWGGGLPAGRGGGEPPARLYVHTPYAIVTVSDACPWIGGKSSSSLSSCPRPCRNGAVRLSEPSMGGDLIQKGKARFSPAAGEAAVPLPGAAFEGTVVYDDVP